MKAKNLFNFIILFFFITNSFAQKTNAEKIVGCWVLKNMEFITQTKDTPALVDNALNSTVCFDAHGKFTTLLGGANPTKVNGIYKLSADGTTLSQSRDINEEGIDEEADIAVLDDKKLELKLDFGTMYFERK